jgi:hypothetical protein
MDKQEKVQQVLSMIDRSERFKLEYGVKLKFLKLLLPVINDELLDKIYGYLILEQTQK